uniref:NADH-ubiquinone oxidoreductase chain 2 n=1 Tax=Andrena hunanensis TaxID=2572773 RepID=A0A4D6SVW9_9HYME|nr:NADH dehydrogenase subunit 2 [Andrena hunanensis]
MNFTNKSILQITIITSMIMLNLIINNKMFMWMTLEISTMSFISMMIMSKSYTPSIMYFIVSFVSSTMLMLGLTLHPNINLNMMIMVSIMIKIAMFPFNYWFNLMSKSINYMNLSILMTLMKFIPMNIMHMTTEMNQLMMLMIVASMIISPVMSINKYSTKLILSYSSIHQTSMMMMIMYMNFYMFITYFTLYTIITLSLVYTFSKTSNKMKYEFIMNKKMKITLFITMIMYSYFPPMTTFIMKWSLIENMIMMNNQLKLISLIVVMSSFVMIWSYLTFMNNNIYSFNNFNKMFMNKPKTKLQTPMIVMWIIIMSSMMYMYINF